MEAHVKFVTNASITEETKKLADQCAEDLKNFAQNITENKSHNVVILTQMFYSSANMMSLLRILVRKYDMPENESDGLLTLFNACIQPLFMEFVSTNNVSTKEIEESQMLAESMLNLCELARGAMEDSTATKQ